MPSVTEDLGGGGGEVVEGDVNLSRILTEAFCSSVREFRKAVEEEYPLMRGKVLCRRIRQFRQAGKKELSLMSRWRSLVRVQYRPFRRRPSRGAFPIAGRNWHTTA